MIQTTLVSPNDLQQHLDTWLVVDCRFDLGDEDWGHRQYLESHIPGAVYASLSHDLAGPRTGTSGRHPLPSIDALASTFARLGIDAGTQVVAYDQDTNLFASRLWWCLRYLGHDAVALLDGGWARWLREGRPVASGEETRPPRTFVAAPRPEMAVTIDQVQRRLGDPDTLLMDARGPERFEGRTEPIDRVAGHIPGAINRFYRLNLDDSGTMRSPEQLRADYDALLGGRAPSQAIVYCGSGVSACHNVLAMEIAGLRGTKLYVGSWSEWSKDPARPVETGPSQAKGN